jgi:hypothetical protein
VVSACDGRASVWGPLAGNCEIYTRICEFLIMPIVFSPCLLYMIPFLYLQPKYPQTRFWHFFAEQLIQVVSACHGRGGAWGPLMANCAINMHICESLTVPIAFSPCLLSMMPFLSLLSKYPHTRFRHLLAYQLARGVS